ncbi:B-box zinc finger protein (macronuclear) [Tetrahymena thermophila SB210]|uniref:B-box zinc finger protein n=1 Tax=Tetrahymena thermophila (strain SB210) TaxID=312017 RepID=I7M396_TETTS|nr:B-box zinc finger protein [Tetrahymena thermophila SB210]EAS02725.2 B-box zinc finger protein [Tetrahymena thermophila SB210]|eukprot:XP_001022970.2 B-box zinc finger protein [Tetrahymena thermophila SB210]
MRPQRSCAGKKRYNPEEYDTDQSYKNCFDIFCTVHLKERIISVCKDSKCDQESALICSNCVQSHKKHKTILLNTFFKDIQHFELQEYKNFRKIFESNERSIKDNLDKLETVFNQFEDLKNSKEEINKITQQLDFFQKQSKIQKKHLKMIKSDQFFEMAEQETDIFNSKDPLFDIINLFAKSFYASAMVKSQKEKANTAVYLLNQETIIQKMNELNEEIKSQISKINKTQKDKQQIGETPKYGALIPICYAVAHSTINSSLQIDQELFTSEERKDIGLIGYINKEKFLTIGRNNQLKIWEVDKLNCVFNIPFQLPVNQSFFYCRKMNLVIMNGHPQTKKGFSLMNFQNQNTSLKLVKHFNVRNHLFDSILNSFIKNQKLLLIQRQGTKTHVGMFDVKRRKYIKQYLFKDQFTLSCCMPEIPSFIALASMKTNRFGFLNLITGEEVMDIADDIDKFAIYTIEPFRDTDGELFFAISLTTNLTQNHIVLNEVYEYKLLIFKLDQSNNKWILIYQSNWGNHILQIQHSRKLNGLLLLEGFDPKNYKHSNYQYNEVEFKMKNDERFRYFKLSFLDMFKFNLQTLLTQKNEIMSFLHNDLNGKTILFQENSMIKVNQFNYDYIKL